MASRRCQRKAALERGYRARTSHCVEVEGGAPYLPIVEIIEEAIKDVDPEVLLETLGDSAPEVARVVPHLRRLFPDIPPPLELPPEQERRYLFNSIRQFIARAGATRPQVFVLNDLHRGDEATLLLLTHLAERADAVGRGHPRLSTTGHATSRWAGRTACGSGG